MSTSFLFYSDKKVLNNTKDTFLVLKQRKALKLIFSGDR